MDLKKKKSNQIKKKKQESPLIGEEKNTTSTAVAREKYKSLLLTYNYFKMHFVTCPNNVRESLTKYCNFWS